MCHYGAEKKGLIYYKNLSGFYSDRKKQGRQN